MDSHMDFPMMLSIPAFGSVEAGAVLISGITTQHMG